MFYKIKEVWKMFRGYYRIEPIPYSKTMMKFVDILSRRRRSVDADQIKRITKAIMDFNEEVESINY